MNTTHLSGELEIDHDRGVIYFHSETTGRTELRICRLPKPIPMNVQLDVTHLHGASWTDGQPRKLSRAMKMKATLVERCPHFVKLPAGAKSPTESVYKLYDIAEQGSVLSRKGGSYTIRSSEPFKLRVLVGKKLMLLSSVHQIKKEKHEHE